MTAISDTGEHKGFKLLSPPEWGIEPVPQSERRLGFVDFAVLWGDLGIGLLVLLAGVSVFQVTNPTFLAASSAD